MHISIKIVLASVWCNIVRTIILSNYIYIGCDFDDEFKQAGIDH
jgi:hypothetical protein